MRSRFIGAFALCLALLACLPALGAEGRIPVFLPGAILAADGKYILTRNLIAPAGPVISICARDVDLDLNGFLVSNSGPGSTISIGGGACGGSADHAAIRNGNVAGGGPSIEVIATRKVDLEDLKIHDSGGYAVLFDGVLSAAVRRVEIDGASSTGINWTDPGGPKVGTIENNIIRRTRGGIEIRNKCSSVAILNNRLEEMLSGPGFCDGDGILISECKGSLISENTVEDANCRGIAVLGQSRGNKLFDNVVFSSGSSGIHIDASSSDNLVLNNVVTASGVGGTVGLADGLLVEGTRNLIERNILDLSTGFGLRFCGAAACGNTFGRNMARSNSGGFSSCAPAACGGGGTSGPVLFPPNSCNQGLGCPAVPGPNSTFGDNLIPGPPPF